MYVIEKHQIAIPDDYTEDTFLGKVRYRFKLDGYDAWLVVPHNPIPGKYWFAVPEWPTAFPDRNGVNALLDMLRLQKQILFVIKTNSAHGDASPT